MDNYSALFGKKLAGGGGSGTSNYNELENKPQINGNTLSGNKSAANLGLQSAINQNNKLDADLLDDSESEKKLVSENDISNWNNKYDSDDAYTKVQTDNAIETAIAALDVAEAGGTGQYISAISEENGKIAATPTTFDTVLSSSSTNNNAPTSKTVFDDQQRQETEIGAVANRGAKNFLDVQHPTTTTRTSYTPLANGGVELSCSNAAWTSYAIADIPVEAGVEYTITFLVDESSGTSNFSFFLRDCNSSGTNLATKNYGSTTGKYEASFTPSNSAIWIGIYLNNSATAATATAKLRCMIRPASITDSTFVPYAPTNRELYEMIQALQSGTRSLSLSAPSENLSKGTIYTTAEEETETIKSEIEKTKQEAESEIEEKEGAEER